MSVRLALILLAFSSSILPVSLANDYPELEYYVTDLANVLTIEEELAIEELCVLVYELTGAEIAILVVNSTQPEDINIFATRTFQQNGIGQEGKDNGLLVLVSTEDMLWRIEVGYGLESSLPDAKVGLIATTYLVPSFEVNDFYTGIYNAVDHLGGEIVVNYEGEPQKNNEYNYPISWIPLTFWQLVFVVAIIMVIVVLTRGRILALGLLFIGRGKGGKRWGGGRTGGGGAGGRW